MPEITRRQYHRDLSRFLVRGSTHGGALRSIDLTAATVGLTAATFQGSAWARYDQWIDGKQTDTLLTYAAELIRLQGDDGSIRDDDAYRAVVYAYNDFLAQDYCAVAPDRLIGLGVIPWTGVDYAIRELERCARLQRPALAVRQRHESGFRHGERVAARRQLRQVERARIVGEHAATTRQFGGRDEHSCALDGLAAVGRDHAAGDAPGRRGRGLFLRRRVARRLLRPR